MIERPCEVCGVTFQTSPSKNKRCCSKSCAKKKTWTDPGYRDKQLPQLSRPHTKEAIEKMRRAKYNGAEKVIRSNGYIYVYAPDYPRASNSRVPEQVLIAERALGRYLRADEVVHHINRIRTDNRPENLLICTVTYHCWLHREIKRREKAA